MNHISLFRRLRRWLMAGHTCRWCGDAVIMSGEALCWSCHWGMIKSSDALFRAYENQSREPKRLIPKTTEQAHEKKTGGG